MLLILVTLAAIAGMIFGLLFRATVLPVLTMGLAGGICVDGWLWGTPGIELLVRIVGGLVALEAGYIMGLWIGQLLQQRK